MTAPIKSLTIKDNQGNKVDFCLIPHPKFSGKSNLIVFLNGLELKVRYFSTKSDALFYWQQLETKIIQDDPIDKLETKNEEHMKQTLDNPEITYFSDDLTTEQKLYCCITGYEGPNASFSSARNDYYFDLETESEKIEHLKNYCENVMGEFLSFESLRSVMNAIDTKTPSSHGVFSIFKTLSNK